MWNIRAASTIDCSYMNNWPYVENIDILPVSNGKRRVDKSRTIAGTMNGRVVVVGASERTCASRSDGNSKTVDEKYY